MDELTPTARTTPHRYPGRVSYDAALVHGILDEALTTARTSVVERDRAEAAVAELERAVMQTEKVVEQQRSYSISRAKEIDRQQTVIRKVLTRSATAITK